MCAIAGQGLIIAGKITFGFSTPKAFHSKAQRRRELVERRTLGIQR
jgi:hypothetical protein